MKFCDNCGMYLRKTENGLRCPKCKRVIRLRQTEKPKRVDKKVSTAVYVIDKSEDDYVKVSQTCPKCGKREAYHWFSEVFGEHAGVRRERTVEHFKCTGCSHSWTEIS